ncbi:hypothetical protein BO86DRAFT_453221 [Aspergillus japonicus CBS 114.51]|uniref:Copper acquisition factor BIM1-like domain-containing protein n=2 Tax=Aspergillus TaxID=5052 RepID=A0A2V5HEY4_ASPV1|nr:hypothetical protein BO86DRAFT_453221 [Aspergillus japonicus CBS 114.51]PYI14550.1 hypothetical protein BO99DRAFT_406617 [Aspergillus violaceofuscus CBS 115571]RAH86110.1 hypothetical protein BO86DRAFT_453221 [Aspergillus japonicus CBS 114.51]
MKAFEMSISQCIAALTLLSLSLVNAHSIITYPGYRGNNLHTNGTVQQTNGLGVGWENGSYVYPYGMQWIYPCGGMPTSTNRTKWPVNGGAIALQPGWFQGHSTAFMYINMGLGTVPENMSLPMVPVFEITGPSNNPYPGTICLPQVPLPADISPKVGDNATIQIVEVAKHGASLYDCVDITFADDDDVAEVTKDNCFNSSDIGFKYVFASSSLTATNVAPLHGPSQAPIVSVLLAMALGAWIL